MERSNLSSFIDTNDCLFYGYHTDRFQVAKFERRHAEL